MFLLVWTCCSMLRRHTTTSLTAFYALRFVFPLRKSKFNRNINQIEKWMSHGLLISRNTKIKLYKLAAKYPTTTTSNNYKRFRNVDNSTVCASKKLFFENEPTTWANQANLKKSWQNLRKKSADICRPPSQGKHLLDHWSMRALQIFNNVWASPKVWPLFFRRCWEGLKCS